MKTDLPFKHENQKNFFNKIHPLTRFIFPFILIIPTLFQNDIFLILTVLIIVLILSLVLRLQLIEVLSRIKFIVGFLLLILIFIPFYVGENIVFNVNIGIQIIIYQEGIELMILIFLRVFTAALTFVVFFTSLTYSEFIEALITIRIIPSILVGSIIIMLHYIPILASSNKKVLEAQELRGKNMSKYSTKLKTHAFIMGKNLINNMERSERLYESLKMRGFTGKITFIPPRFRIIDYLIIIGTILFMIIIAYVINLQLLFQEVIFLFLP
jgi:energy-coupling factor transporter transmembrane protein EcfT